jgi:hypothetical protein
MRKRIDLTRLILDITQAVTEVAKAARAAGNSQGITPIINQHV